MTTGIALPVILHFGQQLGGPDLGAHTDFGSVVDQFALFRLLGIDLHRNGLVANVFDLVDAPSLGQSATSFVVFDERGHGVASESMAAIAACSLAKVPISRPSRVNATQASPA